MLKFYFSINYIDFIDTDLSFDELYVTSYEVDHIPLDTPYQRRSGLIIEPKYITVHNTNNPSSTARNERDWLTNDANHTSESFHIVIDDRGAIEAIPLDEVAWHIEGAERKHKGSYRSLGIVICESGDANQTIENAAKLIANMLYERGWEIDRLLRHYDWNRKNCPRKMNKDGAWSGWDEFLMIVESKLLQLKANPF